MILSGTISERITHHLPVYCITYLGTNDITHENDNKCKAPHYDYSNHNMNDFLNVLPQALAETQPNNLSFDQFTDILKTTIDKTFISDSQNKTKRNYHTNPWITQGIITSVKNKHSLYKTWKNA